MLDDYLTEFCKNCNRQTHYWTEHESAGVPGVFGKLKVYCKECRKLTREVTFE